jgi:hypothetical protein
MALVSSRDRMRAASDSPLHRCWSRAAFPASRTPPARSLRLATTSARLLLWRAPEFLRSRRLAAQQAPLRRLGNLQMSFAPAGCGGSRAFCLWALYGAISHCGPQYAGGCGPRPFAPLPPPSGPLARLGIAIVASLALSRSSSASRFVSAACCRALRSMPCAPLVPPPATRFRGFRGTCPALTGSRPVSGT